MFWYWRRSLRGAASLCPRASKQARAAFTPVEFIARESAAGIVIRLPRGTVVDLPADRPELLQAALSALTAESPAC